MSDQLQRTFKWKYKENDFLQTMHNYAHYSHPLNHQPNKGRFLCGLLSIEALTIVYVIGSRFKWVWNVPHNHIIDDNNNNSVHYIRRSLYIIHIVYAVIVIWIKCLYRRVFILPFSGAYLLFILFCVYCFRSCSKNMCTRDVQVHKVHTRRTRVIYQIYLLIFAETFLLIFHSQQRKKCVT